MPRTPLSDGPLIYGHRGDRSRADDNTIEAYRLAVEAGADGIELDVRRTVDGVLIVHHDDRNEAVGIFSAMTFSVLRSMAPSIPTLKEAMAAIPRSVFVNVEIKNMATDAGFDEDRAIVDETIEALRLFDDPDRILLSSFDPVAMERATSVGAGFLLGQLLAPPVAVDVGIAYATSNGLHALNPQFGQVSENEGAAVGRIKDSGLAVVVWGVDTPDDVRMMADAGAAVIITDNPSMALNALS